MKKEEEEMGLFELRYIRNLIELALVHNFEVYSVFDTDPAIYYYGISLENLQ